MKPFDELRQLASERRDAAIQAAKDEYREVLRGIATIERQLGISTPPKYQERRLSLADAIVSLMPHDRTFCLDDACRWLSETDPSRTFTRGSITSNLYVLVKRGIIKRVRYASGNQCSAYAVPSFVCDDPPSTILDFAEAVIREAGQPMTATEIMVAMLESGFEPEIGPKRALGSLLRGMSKRHLRFVRSGQKWSLR